MWALRVPPARSRFHPASIREANPKQAVSLRPYIYSSDPALSSVSLRNLREIGCSNEVAILRSLGSHPAHAGTMRRIAPASDQNGRCVLLSDTGFRVLPKPPGLLGFCITAEHGETIAPNAVAALLLTLAQPAFPQRPSYCRCKHNIPPKTTSCVGPSSTASPGSSLLTPAASSEWSTPAMPVAPWQMTRRPPFIG